VSGHDFSRAESAAKSTRALAPEACFFGLFVRFQAFFRNLFSPLKDSEFSRAFRPGPLQLFQDLKGTQLQPWSVFALDRKQPDQSPQLSLR